MKRVTLIGVSGFASVHFRDLQRQVALGTLRIVAAAVLNQPDEVEKCDWLREHGCRLFDDYTLMLASMRGHADLCVVPTGIHWHHPMLKAALQAGMDVLLEKPAAPTINEVNAMQDLERRYQRRVYVAYQHMYAPEVWAMKAALLAGEIGRLRMLKCQGIWPRPDAYYQRNDWAGKLRAADRWILDSPFNNAFAHWLNLLCFLSGSKLNESCRPLEIQAELYRARLIQSADTACMRIRTSDDITLMLFLSHAGSQQVNPTLEVCGTAGFYRLQEQAPDRPAPRTKYCIIDKARAANLRDTMYAQVLNRLSTAYCPLEIARYQTLCANGAHESSSIHDIPEEYLNTHNTKAGPVRTIEGITETMDQAYREELLFSELKTLRWTRSGKKFRLENYLGFSGGQENPTDLTRMALS